MDPPVSGINRMDPPASGDEIKPEKLEEAKEGGPLFHCDLADSEVVYKIAQALLPGLASACVDNTTGLLRTSASVAVDIRRDMVDYLVQRSESFVAESVVLEGGTDRDVSDNPFDVISNFIDDFAASKRNFLSKVSGWLLSDRREDRIDDFLQEMDLNGFWLIGRRESVAQTLLKNVDFKNAFHCNMNFKASNELDDHKFHCGFRSITCTEEGCEARFSACHLEQHESVCPFKIIPCEQKCPDSIMRREMDRHCITVCTMKLVNCPFYQIGCRSTIPQCKINEHVMDNLQSHMLHVLRILHKGFSEVTLKKRLDEIEEISSFDNLASLRDARSLTNAVKNYERKLGPIEEIKGEPDHNVKDGQSENKESTSSSSSADNLESPHNNGEVLESTVTKPELTKSLEKKDSAGSPASIKDVVTVSTMQAEDLHKSPKEKEKSADNVVIQSKQESTESLDQDKEFPQFATEIEKHLDRSPEKPRQSTSSSEKSTSPVKLDEMVESLRDMKRPSESSDRSEEHEESPTKKDDQEASPIKRHELEESLVKVSEQALYQDEKFQESTIESQKDVNLSTEKGRQSTSSSEKSTSPIKSDERVEPTSLTKKLSESSEASQEHETSPTKKDDHEDSPSKMHEVEDSDIKNIQLEDSTVKSDKHESSSDESDEQQLLL